MTKLAAVLPVLALSATPAYAYLDPGTGSMLVQALVAGLAVASAGVAAFWTRIRQLFSGRRKPADSEHNDASRS